LVAKGLSTAQSADILKKSLSILEGISDITPASTEEPLRGLVELLGFSAGQVFGVLRVAVTGQKISPPLFESMEIIGKEMVIKRIKGAISQLEKMG
jgi:glutamyl-tRNA synthetase